MDALRNRRNELRRTGVPFAVPTDSRTTGGGMEGQRFDDLARSVAAGVSRRQAVKTVLAGASAWFLSLPGVASLAGQDSPLIQPRDEPDPSDPPESPAEGATELVYIALGDSIAAGHGLDDPDRGEDGPGCPDCCRRAAASYPYVARDELLRRSGYQDVRLEHLACTGATALDPYVPHAQPLRLLAEQVERARARILTLLAEGFAGPVLVSHTVGANDFRFADPETFLLRLYFETGEESFDQWAENMARLVRNAVRIQGDLLLTYPPVRLVVTEVPNPFNAESVFFLSADDLARAATGIGLPLAGDRCAGVACWARVERAAARLNEELQAAVRELGEAYPGRVAITEGLAEAFGPHAAPRGEWAYRLVGQPPLYRRPCCGQALPDVGDTWIQHRYDPASTSRPDFGRLGFLFGPEAWRGDCVHPNAEGARQIALKVVEAGARLLAPTTVVEAPTPTPQATQHDGCPTGLTRCGRECVDLGKSGWHCGACGHQCGLFQTCCDGVCGCPESMAMFPGGCAPGAPIC